jgi:hypothetical protein
MGAKFSSFPPGSTGCRYLFAISARWFSSSGHADCLIKALGDPFQILPQWLFLGFTPHPLLVSGQVTFRMLYACKRSLHAVVVELRDRVKLVIVTSRAIDCDTQKRRTGRQHHVVQFIGTLLQFSFDVLNLYRVMNASHQKACSHRHLRLVGCNLVSRQLFQYHPAEWLVLIEGADDVIPKRPGPFAQMVLLVTMALPEEYDVQPVPAPTLPVVRRS